MLQAAKRVGLFPLWVLGTFLAGGAAGFAHAQTVHENLAHEAGQGGTAPPISELTRAWQNKLQRASSELDEETGRTKALERLLQALVDATRKLDNLADAKGRKIEEREETAMAVRYMEGLWRTKLQNPKYGWMGTWLVEQALGAAKEARSQEQALKLLVAAGHADAEPLLLHLAKDIDSPVRLGALRAMCHWPKPALDAFLVEGYCHSSGSLGFDQLLLHRVQAHGLLDQAAAEPLLAALEAQLAGSDWQVAGTALLLTRGLMPEKAVVPLVRAMPQVARGVDSGRVRWRILANIGAELRRLTGRSMGSDPRPWQTFLDRFLLGELPLRAEGSGDVSEVEFFGIGKVSDHVTFVLDTSGSMQAPFATTGHSAYEEAVQQLMAYLERMGPETWFQVVTFSTSADTLFPMSQADPKTLKALRALMDMHRPDGGTELGKGIDEALDRIAKEAAKGKDRASDTIVVLCDGATAEGRAWAEQRLSAPDFPRGLRFYCVQIGAAPSQAMRALAELTGGSFVRI